MNLFGKSPKINKDYETFKNKYNPSKFKSEFTNLFKAAITDIKKFKKVEGAGSLDSTTQEVLVRYYVNAKLVDTEILTKIVFNKLNDFFELPDTDSKHASIKELDLEKLCLQDNEGKQIAERNKATSDAFNDILKDAELNDEPYFLRLLVLLLTIHYYPYTIVETIFLNGKNNIESIIKNIRDMSAHAADIQQIVDKIDPPPVAAGESATATGESAAPAAAPAANNGAGAGIQNAAPTPPGGFFGALGSWLSPQGGGQVGGTNDVASILETINKAQLTEAPDISQLVKYSTNIYCKALTLLSVSISFPSDANALLTIMPQLYANIDRYFISKLTKGSSDALKGKLDTLITQDNYINIIANISDIYKTIKDVNNVPAVPVVAAPRLRAGTIAENAAMLEVDPIINEKLASQQVNVIASAKEVAKARIQYYVSKSPGIDQQYSKDVANAIADVYDRYGKLYELKHVAEAAKIAANKAYDNKPYDDDVRKFLNTKIPIPILVGGAQDDNYSLNVNLQKIIIKGIESSTFFRLSNDSAPVSGPAKGGQRTQKNRNRNRGGTRRNMNPIESIDSIDSIDSDDSIDSGL